MDTTIRRRWLAGPLRAALEALPVVVLMGARQTGKTTLAQLLPGRRAFLSLDDLGVLDQARADPDALLANRPLTLDEVQRAPELFLPLKRAVDRSRRRGDFLLTGSANLLLMAGVAKSLAGRAMYLELAPFCPTEWLEQQDCLVPLDRLFETKMDLSEWPRRDGDWRAWLLCGGFPPALAAASDAARNLWYAGYVQTYLERDLRRLSAVARLPDFQRLMHSRRTGRGDCSISPNWAAMPQWRSQPFTGT